MNTLMTIRRSLVALAVLVPLVLSACSSTPTAQTPASIEHVNISGAKTAIVLSLSLLKASTPTIRSAPLLSVYVNLMLSNGMDVPVTAAMEGVQAQLKLHGTLTEENVDDLYSLLEEFGAVLHVGVNDLLNRSDNRAKTLDEYSIGLGNITERSKRRTEDLKEQIASLTTEEREQKKAVSDINKQIKKAIADKDFRTAQDEQNALTDAQTELTKTDLHLKELQSIQATFKELLIIADQRIAALDQNREVIIAGLKVIDVPGVDDLGVIQGKARGTNKKKSGGFSAFGGL